MVKVKFKISNINENDFMHLSYNIKANILNKLLVKCITGDLRNRASLTHANRTNRSTKTHIQAVNGLT